MADLIFSATAGLNDSVFGKSAYPIHMIMEQSLEAHEKKSVIKSLYNVKKSENWAEQLTAMSAMDNWEVTPENGTPKKSGMQETFKKVIEHHEWTNEFDITRKMADDSKIDLMELRAKKMAQSYARTREEFGIKMITHATEKSLKFQGQMFDTTAADNLPLFSKAHPSFFNSKNTQSNLYAGEFSNMVLAQLESIMQEYEGDKGEVLAVSPDTIIIPNDAKLKYAVFEAIGADKDPETSNNGFNYNYGRWNVICIPKKYWNISSTANTLPFILLDSDFNKVDTTAVWFERKPMEVNAYTTDDNRAAIYSGYARFGVGFNNWRGMLMGGVESGTAL